MDDVIDLEATIAALRAAGCVAATEEADHLAIVADGDAGRLAELVARRCQGEPLAWLMGSVTFCGETVLVRPGVYVPRWQSEPLTLAAVARLPEDGVAVDLCTGAGAVAVVLQRFRPDARVVATELDPVAADCARTNGVEVYQGDLVDALPAAVATDLAGRVDVVAAVVPYVPSDELRLLPRDVVAYEPRLALDGGPEGTAVLVRAVEAAAGLLRPGGSLLLELGGDEADQLAPILDRHGFGRVEQLHDEDGDLRAVVATRA